MCEHAALMMRMRDVHRVSSTIDYADIRFRG